MPSRNFTRCLVDQMIWGNIALNIIFDEINLEMVDSSSLAEMKRVFAYF